MKAVGNRGIFLCALASAVVALDVAAAQRSPARTPTLRSGPMVGRSEMREVTLWAQTTGAADVHFVYWDTTAPGVRHRTEGERTRAENAFTTRQGVTALEPGRRYAYEIWVNGVHLRRPYPLRFQTQALWQWRTDPPAFRIVVGSCFYVNDRAYDRPGAPYGGNYEILSAITAAKPDAMVWVGDNVYYREADWYARSSMLYRYTHTRSLDELQPLLGSVHHYATWDDHDYGPNDSDGSWVHKETALDVFKAFWPSPTYGVNGRPGVTTMFQWGDVDFFLLDNRYYRTANTRRTGERTMFGREQLEWLINALTYSRAPFKIVVGGNPMIRPDTANESFADFPEEQRALLDRLAAERIPGLFFISGDWHVTELVRLERPDTYPLYELTASPLTAGPAGRLSPTSVIGIAGTRVDQRNFATLDFSGPRTDRSMKITAFDAAGRELWTRSIKASELRAPRR